MPEARAARAAGAGVPAVIIGSLALSLLPSPAHATTHATVSHHPVHFITSPSAAKTVHIPMAAAPSTYTVRAGDTVSAVAARFGLRTGDVLALNGLTPKSTIYPGQVLQLSGAAQAAPAAVVVASRAAPVTSPGDYTVARGDTISGIARRHGVTTAAVLAANGLQASSIIYPGQRITIPAPGTRAATAAPVAPVSAPASVTVSGASRDYAIQRGDTISGIAGRHGVTAAAVLAVNGLQASSIIYPGQHITIPTAATPPAASPITPPAAVPVSSRLDAEQAANAQLIIRIGRELGVPDRGIAIALGTAMQESWLRNLDWGDRDSLGLFQQRPAAGWGTAAEVHDPVRATRVFFGGASDPNDTRTRGLLDIPGWQSMTFTQAAQAVQISAHPDRYTRWEGAAAEWMAAWG